jgi:SAM-dependent methyltransferase
MRLSLGSGFRAQSAGHFARRFRVNDHSYDFFSSAPMRALLARELAALAPLLDGVYGSYGLYLSAPGVERLPLPVHLLGRVVELRLSATGECHGELRCDARRLPFVSESFKLVIVQHGHECYGEEAALVAELARVLAPEGVALLVGFNPFGSWRPWLDWQMRHYGGRLHLRSASLWRSLLAREAIDTLDVRFPGALWPRATLSAYPATRLAAKLARFGSSWLLLAQKRRSTLTPLRLRRAGRELAVKPRLLPGAHRQCA